MFTITVLLAVATVAVGIQLRHQAGKSQAHQYWFNKDNPVVNGNDKNWDFCDLKCLYLQHYAQDKDFVVVVLTAPFHDTFAACYVKTSQGYTLWSKVVTNNFYEQNCGKDYKDWANIGEFTVKGVYGIGIGKEIGESETYS